MGHPEHDMLFIATQVARAAGLKNPSHAAGNFKNNSGKCTLFFNIGDALQDYQDLIDLPNDPSGKKYQKATSLFDEANTYRMLLRGHAPASEPFRKWVTEVVLPTIRKTGKFDVNASKLATRPRTRPHRTSLASSQPCMPRWLGSRRCSRNYWIYF